MKYIYELGKWPNFIWDAAKITSILGDIRSKQGRLMGRMESLGFTFRSEAQLKALTLDVLKSSEIEGEILDEDQVRSSIARRLGIDAAGLVPSERHVDGVVEMLLDATQNFEQKLSKERLCSWHAVLFPTGRSGMQKIRAGLWRDDKNGPMTVVSGPIGREKIHFQAPAAKAISGEMASFIKWFNTFEKIDSALKAGLAHLWFVTIHPFDDGNGRIARAITDMQLARMDGSRERFYSMSAQIRKERNAYYAILEKTQKGSLDITDWLDWFLSCLERALDASDEVLQSILKKAAFWKDFSAALNERQKEMINKLFDDFEGKLTTSKWAKITKCSQDTAYRDILDLIDKGVLIKDPVGGRSTSYSLKQ